MPGFRGSEDAKTSLQVTQSGMPPGLLAVRRYYMLALVTAVSWLQPTFQLAGEAAIFVFGFSGGFVAGVYFLGSIRQPH